VPILRTNHALRGVVLPAGSPMVEFRYEPASFACGIWLAILALAALVGMVGLAFWRRDPLQ
jgi:hypothetical protein